LLTIWGAELEAKDLLSQVKDRREYCEPNGETAGVIDIVVPPMLLPRRRDEPIVWPAGIEPHPDLLAFLAYWQSLVRPDGTLPSRPDISPFELRRMLPGIAMIDVLPSTDPQYPYRYRWRLLGTSHQQHLRVDLTGTYFEDVHTPERLALSHRAFVPVIRERRPGYLRMSSSGFTVTSATTYFERVIAPLAADGAQVNMLIGMWAWLPLGKAHGSPSAGDEDPHL
jgi:hypothetical protein